MIDKIEKRSICSYILEFFIETETDQPNRQKTSQTRQTSQTSQISQTRKTSQTINRLPEDGNHHERESSRRPRSDWVCGWH